MRPARALTLEPGPDGCPGGWGLVQRPAHERRHHESPGAGPRTVGRFGSQASREGWAGACPRRPPRPSCLDPVLPAPTPPPAPVVPAPGLRFSSHRLVRLHADFEGLLLQRFECDGDGHGGARATRRPRDPHTTCNSRRRHLSAQPRREPTASGAGGARADHQST